MTTQTTSQAAAVTSVAADEGNLKRSIQMKFFAGKETIKNVTIASAKIAAGMNPDEVEDRLIVGGQIIGQIFDVKGKVSKLPDGTEHESLVAIGEFEAANYETGEVVSSTAAYLPGYYLETVQSMLDKARDVPAIIFAVEVSIVATGKTVPYSYEVKNLIRRRPENPLNALKAEMKAAGRLRLPPPTLEAPKVIEGEVRVIEPAIEAQADPEPVLDQERSEPVPARGRGKAV